MNESARLAAIEAIRGPFRVLVDGADIRGFWSQEDAQQAADDFAAKGRPAMTMKREVDWLPVRGSIAKETDRV